MKITLFQKREFEFAGKDGLPVTGIMYGGWSEDKRALEFSSQDNSKIIYPGALKYDPLHYEDVDVETRIFDGRVKFREKS